MMKKKVLILTGGSISLPFAAKVSKEYQPDLIIAVDKGMEAAEELGLSIDYAVGDYDSAGEEFLLRAKESFAKTGKPVIRTYQPEKDATDTEIALSLALSLEPENIVILGATGTRLDHSLANIQVLYQALMREVPAYLLDSHNKIYLADHSFSIRKEEAFGDYLSLIPLTEEVEGLTLTGMKYPLQDFHLALGTSLGVSNQIVEEEAGVSFTDGVLMVFETRD